MENNQSIYYPGAGVLINILKNKRLKCLCSVSVVVTSMVHLRNSHKN
ncbi:hypothetical protein J2T13_002424 [Paenibacillus sp. DS2015]